MMRVTFLGTGTSRGVPVVGCTCSTCRSSNPKNKRLRSSVLVEEDVRVLIDASVDFRQQMLTYEVESLDALILTHHHADHILGIDDLFPFTARSGKALPMFLSEVTLEEITTTFRHLFDGQRRKGVARLQPQVIRNNFRIGSLLFEPIEVLHGELPIFGFRIGDFAYLTDVSHIPKHSRKKLEGLRCLVLDGLRYRPHPTHFTIPQAVEISRKLSPKQTYLMHLTHDVEHEKARTELPAGVDLAYDGLILEF